MQIKIGDSIYNLYDDVIEFLSHPAVRNAEKMKEVAELIPKPRTKSELINRLKALVTHTKNSGWIPVPTIFGKQFGEFHECLLGCRGKMRTFGDAFSIEFKWYGVNRGSMLTLFHLEMDGGNDFLRVFLEKYATGKRPNGQPSLYITTGPKNKNWKAVIENGYLIVRRRNPTDKDLECSWPVNKVTNRAAKLQTAIVNCGETRKNDKGEYEIRFITAYLGTEFKSLEFLDNIEKYNVRVDLECYGKPKNKIDRPLCARGSKFRVPPKKSHVLWGSIEELFQKPGEKRVGKFPLTSDQVGQLKGLE